MSFWADVTVAARGLAKRPGWTVAATGTLALGLAGAITIGSVAHGILRRPLPYHEPDRLVRIYEDDGTGHRMRLTDPNFLDLQQTESFEAVALYASGTYSVETESDAVRVLGARVSADFFRVLGVAPLHGRLWSPEELKAGGERLALVGESFWRRELGARADLDRARLQVGDQRLTVIGVIPDSLAFPPGVELWEPRELEPWLPSRTAHNGNAIARLRPQVRWTAARAAASGLAARLHGELGDRTDAQDFVLVPLLESLVGHLRPALYVESAAAAFLLLIATLNVAGLMLARLTVRRQDLATRLALGAGRGQLSRLLLAESAVLVAVGAGLGLGLAAAALGALRRLAPSGLIRLDMVRLDLPVLAAALALAAAITFALALVTEWRSRSWRIEGELRQARGGGSAGGGLGRLARGAAISLETAAALVVLIGAALLASSMGRLLQTEPGFRSRGIATLDFFPERPRNDAAIARGIAVLDRLTDRIGQLPDAAATGLISSLPLSGLGPANGTFLELGSAPPPTSFAEAEAFSRSGVPTGDALYLIASEGYFQALEIPLLEGRLFAPADTRDAPHVALVSAALARATWPGESALGRRLEFGNMDGDLRPLTVVGVVGNVRQESLAEPDARSIYVSYRQRPQAAPAWTLVMARSGPGSAQALLGAARELLPGVPVRLTEIETVVASSFAERSLLLLLVSVFAGVAVLLAAAGIAGTVAFSVAARSREYAIRMALGAESAAVSSLAMRGGLEPAAVGLLIGSVVALAGSRALAALLFEVPATHLPAYLTAVLTVAGVALCAAWLPGRRAGRTRPAEALRGD